MKYFNYTLLKFLKTGTLFGFCLFFNVAAHDASHSSGYDMSNTKHPANNLTTDGQPSKNDLKKMAESGVKVIVNLRFDGEFDRFDEKILAESLGMKYVRIPIGAGKDFNMKNTKLLDNALNDLKNPVVVHCASSNRVWALLALWENLIKNSSVQNAITFGKSAGMRSTEKTITKLLK